MPIDIDDYTWTLTTSDLAMLERETIALADTLVADGAGGQASIVRNAYFELLRDLKAIARRTAAAADRAIKDAEIGSRVRGHGGGGPSLGDFIGKSDAVDEVEGSVAINDEPHLENAGVGWWWTNEYGYSGHIGRQIQGVFLPSGTPPIAGGGGDVLFVPGRGGKGTIQNPIPDRHFVEDGMRAARTDWHSAVDAARAKFMATVRAAVRGAPRP